MVRKVNLHCRYYDDGDELVVQMLKVLLSVAAVVVAVVTRVSPQKKKPIPRAGAVPLSISTSIEFHAFPNFY